MIRNRQKIDMAFLPSAAAAHLPPGSPHDTDLSQTNWRLSESEQAESRGVQPGEADLADVQLGCHFP